MSLLHVEPLRALGPLQFGMSRASSQEVLGQPEVSFRRSAWESQPADSYPTLGLTLEFGPDGALEAIEAMPPARPVFEDVDLLAGSGRDVLRLLTERSCAFEWSLGVYNIETAGISLFSSSGPNPEDSFGSASVFRRGVPAPPAFFGERTELSSEPLEVLNDRIGDARLGMSQRNIRSIFGEGMETVHFGWATDIFFSGIVAQYDAERIVRRLVATSPAQVSIGGRIVLGIPFREFVEQVRVTVPDCVISDSAVTVGSGGPQASISRAGADDLPISAVSIGCLPPER
ncbi:hypothetical protein ACWD4J_36820 [Streptomyces sp. NPDC002577]